MGNLLRLFFITITTISICFAQEQLLIEPDAGRTPILSLINHSHTSIDLIMYGLTDKQLLSALTDAANRNEDVKVLLEPTPYKAAKENQFAINKIHTTKIHLQTANPAFNFTHQKTLLLDKKSALIMTFNFTHSTFKNSRNFALLITEPSMLAEIEQVFSADWQHQAHITVHNAHLVWSPNNSREKILSLIQSAKSEIDIYADSLTDYQTAGALAKAARAGVQVNILTSQRDHKSASRELNYLIQAGAHVHYDKELFIHAKMLMIDNKRAMLGSINFTQNSIDHNRELSIISEDSNVIKQLKKTFTADWAS